jgi:hypothetical protein
VFFRGHLLGGADGVTFRVINGPEYFYFGADRSNVYKHDQPIADIDPASFYYDSTDSRNKESVYTNKYIIDDKRSEWEYTPPNQIIKVLDK